MSNWLEIDNLNKHFNGVKALVDFSCSLEKGRILGLIGPNGAGKTTLFNVLTGFIPSDSGSISFCDIDLHTSLLIESQIWV
jgi:branched-chain amino acid transport system ATP-binding protein